MAQTMMAAVTPPNTLALNIHSSIEGRREEFSPRGGACIQYSVSDYSISKV
jgi:hypothetical protein